MAEKQEEMKVAEGQSAKDVSGQKPQTPVAEAPTSPSSGSKVPQGNELMPLPAMAMGQVFGSGGLLTSMLAMSLGVSMLALDGLSKVLTNNPPRDPDMALRMVRTTNDVLCSFMAQSTSLLESLKTKDGKIAKVSDESFGASTQTAGSVLGNNAGAKGSRFGKAI